MIISPPEFVYSKLDNPRFIYHLIDPRTNTVRYIGKTKDFKKRYQFHLMPSTLKKNTKKTAWLRSLLNLNLKPIMKVCAITTDLYVNEAEILQIANHTNLTNMTGGGDGQHLISDEVRRKISNSKSSTYKAVTARCVDTGFEYNFKSIATAAKWLGVKKASSISKVCKGLKKYSTAYGYYWSFKKEDINGI